MCIHVQGPCWGLLTRRAISQEARLSHGSACPCRAPAMAAHYERNSAGSPRISCFCMHVQDPSRCCSPERAIAMGACSLQPPGALGLLHLLHQPVSQICLHVQGPCRGCSPEERLHRECAVCNLPGFWACCICGISLHICSSWVPAKPGPDSQWSGQCTGKPAPQPAQAECQHA